MIVLFFWLVLSGVAQAASLAWDYDTTGGKVVPSTATIQRSATQTGTFAAVTTVPSLPSTYVLPATPDNQWYRVSNSAGVSNVVQYTTVAAPPTQPAIDTLTPRVTTLETKMSVVESKNTAQDLSLTAIDSKNAAQDASIAGLQPLAGQLATLSTDTATSLSTLQARVLAVESALAGSTPPPPPSSNLSTVILSADQIEITGLNCTSLKTSGAGLKRVVTCVH